MKISEIVEKYYLDETTFTNFVIRSGLPYEKDGREISIADAYVNDCVEAFWEDNEQKEIDRKNAKLEAERKLEATSQMMVTSGFQFEGYRIVKYCGYISGEGATSMNRGSALINAASPSAVTATMSNIRNEALQALKSAAYDLGGNAVIGVDYDYVTLDPLTVNATGGKVYQPYVFCAVANGNAVVIEKNEE